MKIFYLFLVWSSVAFAQQEYFTEVNKRSGIEHYQDRIYRGCADLKIKQDPISVIEIQKLVSATQKTVEQNFSRALEENQKVKTEFQKDLTAISKEPLCQHEGNNCRARLLATAIYYYQQFRPDIPECQGYLKTPPMSKGYSSQCEVELKYRQSSLTGVTSGYGIQGPGSYKKELIATKNNTTIRLFNIIMHKDKINLHICNGVQSGTVHQYALDINDPGEYWVGLDPHYNPAKNIPRECVEEKVSLHSEFLPTNFDEGRTTVGRDQVEPLKTKVLAFIKDNPGMILTDVIVTSSSSKTPYSITIAGKKMIDPNSDAKNLSLAKERSLFAETVLSEIKASSSQLSHINFLTASELTGPDFDSMDLNDRFVTRMTPGYLERLDALYKRHKKLYEEQALKMSAQDLMDEKEFVNLYQAKYKPFQGFKIQIKGYKKEDMRCLDPEEFEAPAKAKATKQ